nr:MAG TPA: Mannosyl-glycoprotein endo-beta-N-acetylglucosaminidase [Crassvirales sp.]
MKVIPKLQQGNTIESDSTKVVRPEIHEPIKAKPRQYSIVDLGGEPSNDTRSAAERNRDYWHPIKGAKARFKASMSNETNPLVGIERTILPSAAGAALVTTPAAVVGGALGNMTVDKLTGGWGNWLEDKTGIPSEIGVYTNPGAWYGGAKGYKIGKNKLITKSIKGDADLAWNPINKNHWIFNKEARTPSNIAMATANRITPFLSKVEKLPLKVAAYKAAKRTNGNASVSLQDIKTMPADYTGSSILGGGNLEGRNLLAKYIFDENPVVKRMFFNKATSNIKPISRNEARRGFSHGDRYEQLYPGVHNRRYEMSAVVPSGRPLKFQEASEFTEYAGKNPIGKIIGKEAEPVMRMGDKEFMTFRQPGTDYIGPIDDVAGHLVKFQMNKGKLRQTSQDMWKFNPADYAKRWNDSPNTANQVRLIKQAALMDKVGRPFILQQSNPIWIEGKSVRNSELVTMAHGGRFDFKKSPLLKKQEEINGKRDMRKKFIKSSRPTYKKRIKKAQQGMRFVSYNPVSNPTIDYTDITNPINPFSEYNYNTTYDKPEALVVPVRDTNEPDVVANNPIAEPVINKPVASKSVTDKPVTKTANSTWKSPYTNRKQWSTELINAYKKAGITNDNAIRMLLAQDALESSWGKSAQGKYNFGNLTTGSSWKGDYVTGNDKNAKGEAIKQKFRSYNSMDEYAADKIQFLKRLYDFDENDDINKFVAKLTGSNKGKRRYAEAKEYANSLRGVYNSFKAGGIIKYQEPAQPINRSAIRTDEDKNVPKRNRAIYSTFDATWNTPPWYIATAKAARAAYKQVANPDEMDYIVTDSVADAGWRKRLGLSYDSKFLPSNEDGSVRLPSYIEAEIPVDTTLLKDRIARETKIAESKNIMGKDWQLVTGLINLDKQNLDSLRKTYNTGEPTVLNEYSHNSRNLIKNGRLINGAHEYNTPLNILKNYTVQYDSKNRTMNYRDIYDFNGYEWAIPGKKFNIRGSINLDKK